MKNLKKAIHTDGAPKPLGTYSQAIKTDHTVYLSGQVAPPEGEFKNEVRQVFTQLDAVAKAAGGSLHHIVKLTIFLMDFSTFPEVNTVMAEFFTEPYPARSTVQVAGLPKGARIEVEAVMTGE